MPKTKPIFMQAIRTDGGTQPRVAINNETVAEYAEALAAGASFPPIVVFWDGSDYWLAEGFHRYHAVFRVGKEETIDCEVIKGTRDDAAWYASGCNQTHGLRRTNADKRRAVEIAIGLRPEMSDGAIAEHCGVASKTVAAVRAAATREFPESTKRVGRDGRTIDTTNIGRHQASPGPDAQPDRVEDGGDGATMPDAGAAPRGGGGPDAGPPTDREGITLPEHLVGIFARRSEIDAIRNDLFALKRRLVQAWEGGDKLLTKLNPQQVEADLGNLCDHLRLCCMPHAVCPACGGHGTKLGCRECSDRGWLTSLEYSVVPDSIRLKRG